MKALTRGYLIDTVRSCRLRPPTYEAITRAIDLIAFVGGVYGSVTVNLWTPRAVDSRRRLIAVTALAAVVSRCTETQTKAILAIVFSDIMSGSRKCPELLDPITKSFIKQFICDEWWVHLSRISNKGSTSCSRQSVPIYESESVRLIAASLKTAESRRALDSAVNIRSISCPSLTLLMVGCVAVCKNRVTYSGDKDLLPLDIAIDCVVNAVAAEDGDESFSIKKLLHRLLVGYALYVDNNDVSMLEEVIIRHSIIGAIADNHGYASIMSNLTRPVDTSSPIYGATFCGTRIALALSQCSTVAQTEIMERVILKKLDAYTSTEIISTELLSGVSSLGAKIDGIKNKVAGATIRRTLSTCIDTGDYQPLLVDFVDALKSQGRDLNDLVRIISSISKP